MRIMCREGGREAERMCVPARALAGSVSHHPLLQKTSRAAKDGGPRWVSSRGESLSSPRVPSIRAGLMPLSAAFPPSDFSFL